MILTLGEWTPRISSSAYVAPSADVIGRVELGENASVWFQCVLRRDIEPIRIGANSNIQDGTLVHTMVGAPAIVGDWVTVFIKMHAEDYIEYKERYMAKATK